MVGFTRLAGNRSASITVGLAALISVLGRWRTPLSPGDDLSFLVLALPARPFG